MNNSEEKMNQLEKKYNPVAKAMSIIGLILLCIGILCVVFGFIDFFQAMNGLSGMPQKFYLLFIGFPMSAIGLWLLILGNAKKITEFGVSQTSGVAVKASNYMMNGTRDEFVKTAGAVANEIHNAKNSEGVVCPNCGGMNQHDAKFCSKCGEAVLMVCPNCQREVKKDALFCDSCGTRLR